MRRDAGRVSSACTRNRDDLDRTRNDLDELLYAALASGQELHIGRTPEQETTGAAGDNDGTLRCSHPVHQTEPADKQPAATHLITLRHARDDNGKPRRGIPRCAKCATAVLQSPSAPRVVIRPVEATKDTRGAPRCQSPIHFAGELPRATRVVVTAGIRPGIRYCDACAKATTATLTRHGVAFETATIVEGAGVRKQTSRSRQ